MAHGCWALASSLILSIERSEDVASKVRSRGRSQPRVSVGPAEEADASGPEAVKALAESEQDAMGPA